MPTILLSRYECDRNLVPAICVRCGAPADDAIRLPVVTPTLQIVIATLLIVCPPLFLLLVWQLQAWRRFRLPMCRSDATDWRRRDQVTSWAYLVVVLGTYLT